SPDCLKANLIVGRALELDGRGDEAAPLYARADAIDPEGNVRVDLFAAEGASPREVALPDLAEALTLPGEPAPEPRTAAAPAVPAGDAATAEAVPSNVPAWSGPSRRPERRVTARPSLDPSTDAPDDWMALEAGDLDMAPAEIE